MPSELIPWRDEIDRLKREMEQLYERFLETGPSQWIAQLERRSPAIDIHESETDITIHAEIPGLDAQDIEVALDGSFLTIRGERKHESGERSGDVYISERSRGKFLRTIRLPVDVDPGEAEASYSGGVLRIRMTKRETKRSKKIRISAE